MTIGNNNNNMGKGMTKMLRLKEVLEITTLGRTTIYQEMANGEFPKQIKLGKNTSVWLESEINQYLLDRIESRDLVSP